MGAAGAVLIPRVWSVATQWLVAAVAGTAALTDYLTTTVRGSAAVSLVATALAPVLILRRGAMRTPGGRALIAASLVLMALAAFLLTLTFEICFGLGLSKGVFTAAFAAMTILGAPAIVAWPLWQSRDRFLPLAGIMLAVLAASAGFAVLGNPRLAAVTVGLGSAIPMLAMVGRARLSRALRYSLSVARRAIPVSSMSFATALVYPLSLELGTARFGAGMVGEQLLYWPLVIAMGIVSQSVAARALTDSRDEDDRAAALSRWLKTSLALTAVAAIAFAIFRWRLTPTGGESPLPIGMLVAGVAFILSDPICVYFCPPSGWRTVAIGSIAAALLVGAAVLIWPRFMIEHYSVCGPSAIVAALRLVFINHPPLRRRAYVILAFLVVGFGMSAWLR